MTEALSAVTLRPVTRLAAYAVVPAASTVSPAVVATAGPPGAAATAGPATAGPATAGPATGEPQRVLLVRGSARSDQAGHWTLPGGGVDHGELPVEAVVREVHEETGLDVRVSGVRDVVTDVLDLAHRGVRVFTVRVLYDAVVTGGSLREERDGSTDEVRELTPEEAATLPLLPWVARTLDLPDPGPPTVTVPTHVQPLSGVGGDASGVLGVQSGAAQSGAVQSGAVQSGAVQSGAGEEVRIRQRIGVYGVAVRAAPTGGSEVLLTSIAPHAPGAGLWTLPGGGIDHGESVRGALAREVHEETGLPVLAERLLGVDAERFTGRSPAGVLEDFQAVRVLFAVEVGAGEPKVLELDGSTEAVRWVPLPELAALPCVGFVAAALGLLDADEPPTVER